MSELQTDKLRQGLQCYILTFPFHSLHDTGFNIISINYVLHFINVGLTNKYENESNNCRLLCSVCQCVVNSVILKDRPKTELRSPNWLTWAFKYFQYFCHEITSVTQQSQLRIKICLRLSTDKRTQQIRTRTQTRSTKYIIINIHIYQQQIAICKVLSAPAHLSGRQVGTRSRSK